MLTYGLNFYIIDSKDEVMLNLFWWNLWRTITGRLVPPEVPYTGL